jgi:hypothetical protein
VIIATATRVSGVGALAYGEKQAMRFSSSSANAAAWFAQSRESFKVGSPGHGANLERILRRSGWEKNESKGAMNALGQIPALFALEWRLNCAQHDLSSLKVAADGVAGVAPVRRAPRPWRRLRHGWLTETAGVCTYSPLDGTVDDIPAGVCFAMPVYPISIRAVMKPDGAASDGVASGTVGHICFRLQTFLGYVGDEAATRATVSTDGCSTPATSGAWTNTVCTWPGAPGSSSSPRATRCTWPKSRTTSASSARGSRPVP